MHDTYPPSHPLIEVIAGFSAGIASTLVAHPLDVIKTRIQSESAIMLIREERRTCVFMPTLVDKGPSPQFGNSLRLVQDIIRNEGIRTGFYRGLSPNLLGNSISWALYFLWYGKIKSVLAVVHGERNSLSYYDFFLASGTAGTTCSKSTNFLQ